MSTKISTRLGDLPKVNLLPPEIHERKRLQHVQAGAVLAVVAAIAGMSYLYVEATHRTADANRQLAQADEQKARLASEIHRYDDVTVVAAQLAAVNATLSRARASEVKWSGYLADLSVIIPKTSWVTNVNISESVAPGSLASASAAPGSIGTVTVQGVTLNWHELPTYLDALHPEHGFANPYFSTATEKYIGPTKVVQFTSSVQLTPDALCGTSGGC